MQEDTRQWQGVGPVCMCMCISSHVELCNSLQHMCYVTQITSCQAHLL
jgi:hypothetical protein